MKVFLAFGVSYLFFVIKIKDIPILLKGKLLIWWCKCSSQGLLILMSSQVLTLVLDLTGYINPILLFFRLISIIILLLCGNNIFFDIWIGFKISSLSIYRLIPGLRAMALGIGQIRGDRKTVCHSSDKPAIFPLSFLFLALSIFHVEWKYYYHCPENLDGIETQSSDFL